MPTFWDILDVADQIILVVIFHYMNRNNDEPPKTYDLFNPKTRDGLIAQYFKGNRITDVQATPVNSNYVFLRHISKLRTEGYIETNSYGLTDSGKRLVRRIISREPKNWKDIDLRDTE